MQIYKAYTIVDIAYGGIVDKSRSYEFGNNKPTNIEIWSFPKNKILKSLSIFIEANQNKNIFCVKVNWGT